MCACAGKPITLRAALARYADLLSPVSKPSLQALCAFAEGDDQARLRRLLSPDGAAEYKGLAPAEPLHAGGPGGVLLLPAPARCASYHRKALRGPNLVS